MSSFNVSLIILALSLSACGTTSGDRALSGGAIGAGAGAAVGAVTGMGVGTGALIGGAAGAATGALTDEDDINLGKPIWR
ncbi:MAG: YMGG-like glycine zipper-containing protein [Burkholderiales bacterium]